MEHINILWIVNDKYTNNFITVYNECKESLEFNITVMATDRLGYDFSPAVTETEVFEFLKENNVDCIRSKNEVGEYFSLEELGNFDYIFTTTPYDIYLPEEYRSYNIIKHAKLCCVHYGEVMTKLEGRTATLAENEYYKNASFTFYSHSEFESVTNKVVPIGYMKLDEYLNYGKIPKSSLWEKEDSFKIVWKPRWTIDEDDSKLMVFLPHIYEFLSQRPNVEFVYLMHQMLEINLGSKGFAETYKALLSELKTLPNFKMYDGYDFLDVVLSANLLIADHSSIVPEFTITGNPIIYTTPKVSLTSLSKRIVENSYVAESFNEASQIIDDLIVGKDPKKEKRQKQKDSYFAKSDCGESIAQRLLKCLKEERNNLESEKMHKKILIDCYERKIKEQKDFYEHQIKLERGATAKYAAESEMFKAEAERLGKRYAVPEKIIKRIPKSLKNILKKA